MRRHLKRCAAAVGLTVMLSACGGGGGSAGSSTTGTGGSTDTGPDLTATQLAVLYADGDATSEAIARAYQQARGIPEANLVRVSIDTSGDAISAANFATVKAAVDARLGDGIQATLVTWSRPSRVAGATCAMSLTSALAFGYDAAYCSSTCSVTQTSPMYGSSTHQPYTVLRMRPSMMLGATTLADAQALIARGKAADGRMAGGATGHAWLVRTSDVNRSVRWPDLQQLAATTVAGITMHYVDNSSGTGSNVVTGQDNVMFYFTGLDVVPLLDGNSYAPGAVGDALTSNAGYLPMGNGQTVVRAWLQAGLTGSYGTVEEPCAFTEKFPRASTLVAAYARGDTLIEAYWKSVMRPGQGLFVGEPLARPWGR